MTWRVLCISACTGAVADERQVAQLTTFAKEVSRVALEVGTQGILGGQAVVDGVEGVWEDLTTNVNVSLQAFSRFLKADTELSQRKWLVTLTDQVREIAEVVSFGASLAPDVQLTKRPNLWLVAI